MFVIELIECKHSPYYKRKVVPINYCLSFGFVCFPKSSELFNTFVLKIIDALRVLS